MKKIFKSSPITLIELPATEFGALDGQPSCDIYSRLRSPPRALPDLTALLHASGFTNVQMIHPFFHGKNDRLSSKNWQRILKSDILGISSITRTSPQSMALADRYKSANPGGIVIAGGMDPTYRIDDWLNHVDIVVRKEAERTFPELLFRLKQDPNSLDDIAGIAFKKNGEIIITPKRTFLTEDEFSKMPLPYFDEKIARHANFGVIEEQRGCPYGCEFCGVTETYGKAVKFHSPDYMLRALRNLRGLSEHFGNYVFLTGDNLAINPRKAAEMLEAIAESDVRPKFITVQVAVQAAENPSLLNAMQKANVKLLCVGDESANDAALKSLGKHSTVAKNTEAAETFREYGLWVHSMMMLGTDFDDAETIRETVEWTKNHADSAQFFAITPIPGTPFYTQMENQGRILTNDFSLYDGQHNVIMPSKISPYKLQKEVFNAHEEFYSVRESLKRLRRSPNKKLSAAILAYTTFGGLSKVINSPQTRVHMEFLKSFGQQTFYKS